LPLYLKIDAFRSRFALRGNFSHYYHLGSGTSTGQVSVLGLLQSGSPYTVTVQTNTTNAFSAGGLRADLIGDPELSGGERTLARWFNTSAFAQPEP
jgi:hypothetical protein